jgi:Na+/H+ antiporter NhaD/arsenite permease-like protein
MVLLLRKLINNPKQRLVFTGMVIIAANAGGVWSPMGDITSTVLWMGNQVTTKGMLHLFLPSLACLIVPLIICSFKMRGIVMPLVFNMVIGGSFVGGYCSRKKVSVPL